MFFKYIKILLGYAVVTAVIWGFLSFTETGKEIIPNPWGLCDSLACEQLVSFTGLIIIVFASMIIGSSLTFQWFQLKDKETVTPNKSTSTQKANPQSGSVATAVMTAVVLLGVAVVGLNHFMKGPLATSVKITKHNTTETQLNIAARLAVLNTNAEDCDDDGFVEPTGMESMGSGPGDGGLLPSSIGAATIDPWGRHYGYCAWDLGSTVGGGSCTGDRLAGPAGVQSEENQQTRPVIALVSAGPNKTFETTCNNFNGAGDPDQVLFNKPSGSDDVVFDYTYAALKVLLADYGR